MRSVERTLVPLDDVPLAPLSTLGVGGSARWFTRATSGDAIAAAHEWCVNQRAPLFLLGGGSNVVISDEGLNGLVLQMALAGVELSNHGAEPVLHAGAGEAWDTVVETSVAAGLAGLECLSGIPGCVGGTPIQNVGAYGQEVSETIEAVTVFDRTTASTRTLSAADCGFTYRNSRFRVDPARRFIIMDVSFRLRTGPPTISYPDVVRAISTSSRPSVLDVRQAVLDIRRRKGMVIDPGDPDTRSVGSFFMNPVVSPVVHERVTRSTSAADVVPGFPQPDGSIKIPAAWLIEHSGFTKGYTAGRVGLSSKHPLALINRGKATAREVVEFAVRIKQQVIERFDIWLRPEPVFLGFGDDEDVAYLQRGTG